MQRAKDAIYHLLIAFLGSLCVSCANLAEEGIAVSSQEMDFSVNAQWKKDVAETRMGTSKSQFQNGDQVGLFGIYFSISQPRVPFLYDTNDATHGRALTYNGSSWAYSPKSYWPTEGYLDIYACYPHRALTYDVEKQQMNFSWSDMGSPMGVDLLWGESTDINCQTHRNASIALGMHHALAKVNINFDSSIGDVKSAEVSSYKSGSIIATNADGVPAWKVSTDDSNIITATKSVTDGSSGLKSMTVFILPSKITSLKLNFSDDSSKDISDKIGEQTFEAGKEYNLTIKDDNGPTIFTEDANCYILNPPAEGEKVFVIPIKRVNVFWGNHGYENVPENVIKEDTQWNVNGDFLWVQNEDNTYHKDVDVQTYGVGPDGGVKVTVKAGASANIILGLKNNTGTLLWTWHLWVTDYKPNKSDGVMDRNLGALKNSSVGQNGVGALYYQYGRKDPFPGYYFNNYGNVQYPFYPENDKNTMAESVKSSMWFFKQEEAWTTESKYNSAGSVWHDPNVGHGGKSIFDPSPPGWKVPESSVVNYWYGLDAYGRINGSDAKLCDDGTGYYWTSTPSNDGKGINLYFDNNGNHRTESSPTSMGMPIRCVAE